MLDTFVLKQISPFSSHVYKHFASLLFMWFNGIYGVAFIKVVLNESFDAHRYTCGKCWIRCRLHEIGAGISVQFASLTFIYPIGGGGGHIESRRRLRARAGESGLNHNGRATRNANRVYHYDSGGYRLADHARGRLEPMFNIRVWYLYESAISSDPREFWRLSRERNVRGRFIWKLFTQLI